MTTTNAPALAARPAAERETSAGAQILQPGGWPVPKGYANGMAADGRLTLRLLIDPSFGCREPMATPVFPQTGRKQGV